jgi:hypothetical protein
MQLVPLHHGSRARKEKEEEKEDNHQIKKLHSEEAKKARDEEDAYKARAATRTRSSIR